MNDIDERIYIRQTGIIPLSALHESIYIVGCGSIGSWAALSLAKLGCQNITIADGDTVEVHNAGSQVYTSLDEDKLKVEAFMEKLPLLIETPEVIHPISRSITPQDIPAETSIVIMAVDSIKTREEFFTYLKNSNKWFIDGRMAGNIVELRTIKLDNPDLCASYASSLFPEEEASPVQCSMRSVVYNCFVMAGLITETVGRIAQNKPVPWEMIIDLENFALFTEQ